MLLSPLGGLPDRVASGLVNGASVIALALVARQLGGPAWVIVPILFSPIGFWLFSNSQVDALVLLGVVLFNGWEVPWLLIKPQVAIGLVIPRLRRIGPGRAWLEYLAPAIGVGAASLVIWPAWVVAAWRLAPMMVGANWNANGKVWPWSLVLAVILLGVAWRTGEDWLGVVASPLLFPYANIVNYLGLLVALAARWPRWVLVVWGLMWLVGAGFIFLPRLF